MGQDLIGTGFTHDTKVECNIDAIQAAIDSIPDATLMDEPFLNTIDPSGALDMLETADDVRDYLNAGAVEYASTVSGHRLTVEYNIPLTSLWFVFAGGGSWGDDPYDGWSQLNLFVNFLEVDEGVAQLAGFVCGGLPGATIVNTYTAA